MIRLHEAAGAEEMQALNKRTPVWRRGDDLEAFVSAVAAPRWRRARSASSAPTRWAAAGWAPTRRPRWRIRAASCMTPPGVWIGDASAFPTASGTNPMFTVMSLARRTAHAIAAV